MEILLSILAGLLVAAGVYLFLRRHLLQLFFGFLLLSNSVVLVLFTMGRLTYGSAPLVPESQSVIAGAAANPLSQAVILTTIVISFGLQAFLLVLIYRSEKELDTVDVRELQVADRGDPAAKSYPDQDGEESTSQT